VRYYASGSGLGKEEVTGRIVDLLKNFDKVRGGSVVLEVLDRG
jgi:NADH dehydrogenase (ubiquinone) 1 alpha/beta subcomplex 1